MNLLFQILGSLGVFIVGFWLGGETAKAVTLLSLKRPKWQRVLIAIVLYALMLAAMGFFSIQVHRITSGMWPLYE